MEADPPGVRVVSDLAVLDPGGAYWVAAVASPERDWAGVPGCRRGARFLIDPVTLKPGHDRFAAFDTRSACLRWVMANRAALAERAPGARIDAVRLDRWMLGIEAM